MISNNPRNVAIKHSVNNTNIETSTDVKKNKKPRIHKGEFDITFFILILVLMVMGLVMMFSASYYWGLTKNNDGFYYAKKQIIISVFGIVAMLVISKINYKILSNKKIALPLFIGSFLMLIYTTFLGIEHGGARRWLKIGIEFQPSEIMKFSIVVLFAYLIANNYNKMKKFKYGVLPFFIILIMVAVVMLLQPHLSGTLLICSIGIIMIFIGGAKISHLLAVGATGLLGIGGIVAALIFTGEADYFLRRFQSWLEPFSDTSGATWQTCQSLIAIGSGGLFGMGFGESRQKFLYLSESQNDFVFAIVCEELGLIGALLVIMLFIIFVFRGFYIASKAPDKFGMMLAAGLTIQIGIQALLNIAVVSNSIPNTGISLPFFSYGGTALAMQLAQMGVILNISRYSIIED